MDISVKGYHFDENQQRANRETLERWKKELDEESSIAKTTKEGTKKVSKNSQLKVEDPGPWKRGVILKGNSYSKTGKVSQRVLKNRSLKAETPSCSKSKDLVQTNTKREGMWPRGMKI